MHRDSRVSINVSELESISKYTHSLKICTVGDSAVVAEVEVKKVGLARLAS